MNSPHKGQLRGPLMFSLICTRINDWENGREAGDLRRHRTHYDAIVLNDWRIATKSYSHLTIYMYDWYRWHINMSPDLQGTWTPHLACFSHRAIGTSAITCRTWRCKSRFALFTTLYLATCIISKQEKLDTITLWIIYLIVWSIDIFLYVSTELTQKGY